LVPEIQKRLNFQFAEAFVFLERQHNGNVPRSSRRIAIGSR
jgi:hypothetical protein